MLSSRKNLCLHPEVKGERDGKVRARYFVKILHHVLHYSNIPNTLLTEYLLLILTWPSA